MRNLIKMMARQLSAGNDVVLVTVTAATGATPRGAGARMLVNKNGRLCGTIGGGAVEHRAIQIAQTVLAERSSTQHNFSLTRDDVQNLGMICGGAVEVFFHYLAADNQNAIELAAEAEQLLAHRQNIWLLTNLSDNSLGLVTQQNAPSWLAPQLTGKAKRIQYNGQDYFLEQIGTSSSVYIFGGGHVAQELVPLLSHVGFRCVVMDDRPEFTDPSLFPAADEILMVDFTHIDDFIKINADDYVCVMTKGHAYDTLIQAQILRAVPCYIGVIGSAAKAAGVRKSLIEDHGLTHEDVDRITTPIGLKIGAETPAEIAVSIAAQMIEVRAKLVDSE